MGHGDLLVEAADLAETLPKAVALSVNMDSTKVRMGKTPKGRTAPLVEGVVKGSGSLDLITGKAGAGGKVLQRLRESAEARYGSANGDLDTLDDDALVEAVRARPDLAQRLGIEPDPPPEDQPVSGTLDHTKIIEAIGSDEAATTALVEALAGSPAFSRVIEAKVEEARDEGREEGKAETNRLLDLRDMRDEAHRLIEAHGRERGGILTPAYVTRVRGLGAPSAGTGGENASGEPEKDENGEPIVEAEEKDPMAERLGLDTKQVRKHQGVGA
jgi:hypothetical protein